MHLSQSTEQRDASVKPAPKSTAQLTADLQDRERLLIEVQRANNAERTAMPTHIANGDLEEIAACKRRTAATAAEAKELAAAIAAHREAIRTAADRARATAADASYERIHKLVASARRDTDAVADAVVAFGKAQKKARVALDAVDAELIRSGVTPDPYILKAKMVPIIEMALALETEGDFGAAHGLDSPDQLRQNGRADLKRAATEYQVLTMRKVRAALNVTTKEHV